MSYANGPRIVTDGLVLHLDAANRKSYPGSGSTWYDLSGNGNNGTFGLSTAAPTFSSSNGGSIVFDGVNDYINCGSNNSLDIQGNSITLGVWLKASSITSNGHVIAKNSYANGYIIHYDTAYEGLSGGGFQTANVNNVPFEWGENILINNWYYIAYTYDGSLEKGYYNANLVNSKSSSANISSNSSNDLYIGNNSSANDAWHGNISQVSIYNKALNNSEIRQNFEATKGRFGL